jgi:hypothetical protein
VQYQGDPAERTEADDHAIKAWNILANGSGGLDFSGLPYVVARFGIKDVAGLIDRLEVIKNHKPPEGLDQ